MSCSKYVEARKPPNGPASKSDTKPNSKNNTKPKPKSKDNNNTNTNTNSSTIPILKPSTNLSTMPLSSISSNTNRKDDQLKTPQSPTTVSTANTLNTQSKFPNIPYNTPSSVTNNSVNSTPTNNSVNSTLPPFINTLPQINFPNPTPQNTTSTATPTLSCQQPIQHQTPSHQTQYNTKQPPPPIFQPPTTSTTNITTPNISTTNITTPTFPHTTTHTLSSAFVTPHRSTDNATTNHLSVSTPLTATYPPSQSTLTQPTMNYNNMHPQYVYAPSSGHHHHTQYMYPIGYQYQIQQQHNQSPLHSLPSLNHHHQQPNTPIHHRYFSSQPTVTATAHPTIAPSPQKQSISSGLSNIPAINAMNSTMINAPPPSNSANSSMIVSSINNQTIVLPHPHIIASQASAVSHNMQYINSNHSNSNNIDDKRNNNNNNNNNNNKPFGLNNIGKPPSSSIGNKLAANMPHFDIQPKQIMTNSPKQMYCDTSSNTSKTSNVTNISGSSLSITSIATMPPPAASIAIKTEAIKTNKNKTKQEQNDNDKQKEKDKDKEKKIKNKKKKEIVIEEKEEEITSTNGQWIMREHLSGSARTEGYYSLAPRNKRKKFRHLAKEGGKEDSTARHIRINKRRLENCLKQTQTAIKAEHLKLNSLHFRQKNIQFGKSSIHSWGVFALEEIPAEEMVVEYIGEYIKEKYANLREKLYEKQGYDDYMFRVDDDLIIDATKRGNLARFINHSCDPNCYTRIIQVNNTPRVVIYSKRLIKAGEELTYDYKFPIEEDKIQCLCGSKNCRGTLN